MLTIGRALQALEAFLLIQLLSSAQISIEHPGQGVTLTNSEVEFKVRIEGAVVPDEVRGDVYVNRDERAFEVLTPYVAVRAPLEPGFHRMKAVLRTTAENTTVHETDWVHFLVDPPEEYQPHVGPFTPVEPGKVSVVIASHERFDMLMETIESVKSQTYEDWEIIVVNDASNDPRYYQLLEDVMLIHLPYNIGRPGLVRNIGIAASTGEYIAFLDDDDVWLPEKLETQLAAMRESGTNMSCTEAFAGNGSYIHGREYQRWLRDAHGPYAVRGAMESMHAFSGVPDVAQAMEVGHCFDVRYCLPDVWDWTVLIRANFVITTSALIRRDALLAAGPFNNSTLGEDHDLWKRILRENQCVFVREPLVYWRIDSPDKLTQSHRQ